MKEFPERFNVYQLMRVFEVLGKKLLSVEHVVTYNPPKEPKAGRAFSLEADVKDIAKRIDRLAWNLRREWVMSRRYGYGRDPVERDEIDARIINDSINAVRGRESC